MEHLGATEARVDDPLEMVDELPACPLPGKLYADFLQIDGRVHAVDIALIQLPP